MHENNLDQDGVPNTENGGPFVDADTLADFIQAHGILDDGSQPQSAKSSPELGQGRISQNTIFESLHRENDADTLSLRIYEGLNGHGSSTQDPEKFHAFQAQLEQELAGISDEARQIILLNYSESMLLTASESDSSALALGKQLLNDGGLSDVFKEIFGNAMDLIGSLRAQIGTYASLVLGPAVAAPISVLSHVNHRGHWDQSSPLIKMILTVEVPTKAIDQNQFSTPTGIIELTKVEDGTIDQLQKQSRNAVLEALMTLGEEKRREQEKQLIGLLDADSTEAARKAKHIAETELVIQLAVSVLIANGKSNVSGKLAKISERLKQFNYLNTAFASSTTLASVIEEANVNGFAIAT